MHTAPTPSVRLVFAGWVLAAALSVAATMSLTGQEPMEDMCAGEMQWMIGWCLDMVMPGDDVEVARLAS